MCVGSGLVSAATGLEACDRLFHRVLRRAVAAVRDRLPHLVHLVEVDDGTTDDAPGVGAIAYDDLLASGAPVRNANGRTGDDLYVLYTGGTPEQRQQWSYQAQARIMDQAPALFLWKQPELYALSKRVQNFKPNGTERFLLNELTLSA